MSNGKAVQLKPLDLSMIHRGGSPGPVGPRQVNSVATALQAARVGARSSREPSGSDAIHLRQNRVPVILAALDLKGDPPPTDTASPKSGSSSEDDECGDTRANSQRRRLRVARKTFSGKKCPPIKRSGEAVSPPGFWSVVSSGNNRAGSGSVPGHRRQNNWFEPRKGARLPKGKVPEASSRGTIPKETKVSGAAHDAPLFQRRRRPPSRKPLAAATAEARHESKRDRGISVSSVVKGATER